MAKKGLTAALLIAAFVALTLLSPLYWVKYSLVQFGHNYDEWEWLHQGLWAEFAWWGSGLISLIGLLLWWLNRKGLVE